MKAVVHIRFFIFAIIACFAGSCCRVQRFEPREFVISNDTLCLDKYAYPLSLIYLEHAVKYNGAYHCLFDKIEAYRGMYDWGRDPFMLEISDASYSKSTVLWYSSDLIGYQKIMRRSWLALWTCI